MLCWVFLVSWKVGSAGVLINCARSWWLRSRFCLSGRRGRFLVDVRCRSFCVSCVSNGSRSIRVVYVG